MTVTELIQALQKLNEDIGCDGKSTFSHEIPSHVWVTCEDSDADFELERLELDYMPGCSCPYGVTIVVKKS